MYFGQLILEKKKDPLEVIKLQQKHNYSFLALLALWEDYSLDQFGW